jgi:hypothetical protein
VQVSVVTPTGNAVPDGGSQTALAGNSSDTAGENVVTAVHAPGSCGLVMSSGQMICGGMQPHNETSASTATAGPLARAGIGPDQPQTRPDGKCLGAGRYFLGCAEDVLVACQEAIFRSGPAIRSFGNAPPRDPHASTGGSSARGVAAGAPQSAPTGHRAAPARGGPSPEGAPDARAHPACSRPSDPPLTLSVRR